MRGALWCTRDAFKVLFVLRESRCSNSSPLDSFLLLLVLLLQIVNICVDVLTEEKEDGGKRLKDGLAQLSSGKMIFCCFLILFLF